MFMKVKINRKSKHQDDFSNIDPSQIKLEGLEGPKMSVYEMNQAEMKNAEPLTAEQLKTKYINIIYNYVMEKRPVDKYFMLLCKELSYYTIFVRNDHSSANLYNEFLECLDYYKILSIEYNETNGVPEIWVKTPDGDAHCMYFFGYDNGIVPFGRV